MAHDAETLASFLPGRLVRRLVEAPEEAGQPHADRMVLAALLLADISGFMAITERLAERGPGRGRGSCGAARRRLSSRCWS